MDVLVYFSVIFNTIESHSILFRDIIQVILSDTPAASIHKNPNCSKELTCSDFKIFICQMELNSSHCSNDESRVMSICALYRKLR